MIQYRTTFDYTPSGPAPGSNEGEVPLPDDAAPAGFRGLEWELVSTCASVKHIFYTWKRKLIVWTPKERVCENCKLQHMPQCPDPNVIDPADYTCDEWK